MSQSLTKIYIHLVFSTKNRFPSILNEWKGDLHAYLGGILREINNPSICIGGTNDHIHILFSLSKSMNLTDTIRVIKTSSSTWMKARGCTKFAWQSGYAAFSVSASRVENILLYINNQEEHHRKKTFEEEVRALCKAYKIDDYDEKYFME